MVEAARSTALVTGATGFIGAHLAGRLVAEGWSVKLLARNPDRLSPGLRESCQVVVGRLEDADSLRAAVRDVGVIFHCAANVNTWDSQENYYAANVQGVKNLLHAITTENANLSRLVHFSSVDVYGFPHRPCDETSTTDGAGFGYGESKLLGESLVRDICDREHIPFTILRPTNVIGPGSQFVARIGEALKSGIMLTVNGGLENAGLLYVGNLASYAIWAAGSSQAVGECYNLRDDYDASWREFVDRVRKDIGGKGVVLNLPFLLADAVAGAMEVFYRMVLPRHEPLLHRLLVRIFGRTCGHSAEKIRADSKLNGLVGFDVAMRRSTDWFLHG